MSNSLFNDSDLPSSNASYKVSDEEEAYNADPPTKLPLYSFYSPDRISVTLDCGDVMMTKQEYKDECEINNIIREFTRSGILEHINAQEAAWLELPDQLDFQASLEQIRAAEAAFDSLPSIVREKYHNSPGEFLGALSDPSQKDYLTEVGIFAPAWAKASPAEPPATSPAPAATP